MNVVRRAALLALPVLLAVPAIANAATESGEDEFQPIDEEKNSSRVARLEE